MAAKWKSHQTDDGMGAQRKKMRQVVSAALASNTRRSFKRGARSKVGRGRASMRLTSRRLLPWTQSHSKVSATFSGCSLGMPTLFHPSWTLVPLNLALALALFSCFDPSPALALSLALRAPMVIAIGSLVAFSAELMPRDTGRNGWVVAGPLRCLERQLAWGAVM